MFNFLFAVNLMVKSLYCDEKRPYKLNETGFIWLLGFKMFDFHFSF